MKRAILAACLAALAGLAVAATPKAVKRYIQGNGVKLLSKASAFSKSYGTLAKGQAVWAVKLPNGYYKVTVEKVEGQKLSSTTGYLNGRALSDSKPKMTASTRKGGNASSEEVAAATKGFNKQVEAQVKAGNAQLDFDQLDRLLDRTQVQDPEQANQKFRREGNLGEYAQGGGQ